MCFDNIHIFIITQIIVIFPTLCSLIIKTTYSKICPIRLFMKYRLDFVVVMLSRHTKIVESNIIQIQLCYVMCEVGLQLLYILFKYDGLHEF